MNGSNFNPGISSLSGLLLIYKLELVPISERLPVPVAKFLILGVYKNVKDEFIALAGGYKKMEDILTTLYMVLLS